MTDSGLASVDESVSRNARIATWAAGIAAVSIALIRNVSTVADHDLWGHVLFGLDKLDAGGYIAEDQYSYLTSGNTWFNHEWGGEVLMGALYRAWGPEGLVVAKAVVLAAVVAILFRLLVQRGVRLVHAVATLAVAAVLVAPTFGTFRPQIFTVALMTATLLIILRVEDGRPCLAVFLAPLVAVWVNVHGGAWAGVGVIVLWALLRTREPDGRGIVLGSALASVAAFFLAHPLGPRHAWFLITSTLERRPEILDWQPVDLTDPVGAVYGLSVVVIGALVWRHRAGVQGPVVLPLAGLLLAPLSATRHLQLAAVALVVLAALVLAGRPATVTALDAGVLGLVAVVLAGVAVVQTTRAVDCLELDAGQFETPVAGVAALGRVAGEGDVIVPFNWGEYVIWELGPSVRVSVDGRRETIYSDDVLDENLAFERGFGNWDAVLGRGEPVAALLTSGSPTAGLLAERGWSEVHRDPTSVVMTPAGNAAAADPPASASHDGAGLCFPSDR